jgi:hypothetical protein
MDFFHKGQIEMAREGKVCRELKKRLNCQNVHDIIRRSPFLLTIQFFGSEIESKLVFCNVKIMTEIFLLVQ